MTGYVILVLGGLQGILLALFIFLKRSSNPANLYLAGLTLSLALGCVVDNNFVTVPENLFIILWSGNSFLYAPLLFLYILRITRSEKIGVKIILLHLSTFMAMKLIVWGYVFFHLGSTQFTLLLGTFLNFFLTIYNVAYGLLTFRELVLKKDQLTNVQYRWSRMMTVFFLSYSGLLLLRRVITTFTSWTSTYVEDYIYLGITLGIYWISFQIMNQPEVMIGKRKKYQKSGLSKKDVVHIGQLIESYLTENKAYTQSDFNVASLSFALNIPKHQISQVVGVYFGKPFYELIAEFRVKEVQRLLMAKQHQNLSILGIAFECGFQSKSAFNKAFKKITRQTPLQFANSF